MIKLFFTITIVCLLVSCSSTSDSVIAFSGTTIGVKIGQNQATQTPEAELGYHRGEFAYVPTNKIKQKCGTTVIAGNGAQDSAEVLMELKYVGIFDLGQSSGIYQRLAVGKEAVSQSGAAAMFIRNNSGGVDASAAKALEAMKSIPNATNKAKNKKRINDFVFKDDGSVDATKKAKADAIAAKEGKLLNYYLEDHANEEEINAFIDKLLKEDN